MSSCCTNTSAMTAICGRRSLRRVGCIHPLESRSRRSLISFCSYLPRCSQGRSVGHVGSDLDPAERDPDPHRGISRHQRRSAIPPAIATATSLCCIEQSRPCARHGRATSSFYTACPDSSTSWQSSQGQSGSCSRQPEQNRRIVASPQSQPRSGRWQCDPGRRTAKDGRPSHVWPAALDDGRGTQ